MKTVRCLYCRRITSQRAVHFEEPSDTYTVCSRCVYAFEVVRDERLEVEAGMRPWAPDYPTMPSIGRIPLPAAERAAEQAKWDAEQAAIARHNSERR